MNMFLKVAIKNKDGKPIKTFTITGALKLDRVMFWIWRDLFVSLLAYGEKCEKGKLPEMLSDIANLMGWQALEILLYGGNRCE
jgi:hypothetical protein